MRCFDCPIAVEINDHLITKAKRFSISVVPTVGSAGSGYRDTNQNNLQKIQQDHYVGKVGEEAVRLAFQQFGNVVQGPDYTIYLNRQKSWDADLYVNGIGLAVKTQTAAAARRFGLSWTFQSGTHRQDPILNKPESWVCFVKFDEQNHQCMVYPPYQIKELTFGEPKLEKLKGHKRVVYGESLPSLSVTGDRPVAIQNKELPHSPKELPHSPGAIAPGPWHGTN